MRAREFLHKKKRTPALAPYNSPRHTKPKGTFIYK